jgi:hypothetical protein
MAALPPSALLSPPVDLDWYLESADVGILIGLREDQGYLGELRVGKPDVKFRLTLPPRDRGTERAC